MTVGIVLMASAAVAVLVIRLIADMMKDAALKRVLAAGVCTFQIGGWPPINAEIRKRLTLLGDKPSIRYREGMTSCIVPGLSAYDNGFTSGKQLAQEASCRYLLSYWLPPGLERSKRMGDPCLPMLADPVDLVLSPAQGVDGEPWWVGPHILDRRRLAREMARGPFIHFTLTDLTMNIEVEKQIPVKLFCYRYLGAWLLRELILELHGAVREEELCQDDLLTQLMEGNF